MDIAKASGSPLALLERQTIERSLGLLERLRAHDRMNERALGSADQLLAHLPRRERREAREENDLVVTRSRHRSSPPLEPFWRAVRQGPLPQK